MAQKSPPLVSGPWCHECSSEINSIEENDCTLIIKSRSSSRIDKDLIFVENDENERLTDLSIRSRRLSRGLEAIVSSSGAIKEGDAVNKRPSSPMSVTRFPSRCLRSRIDGEATFPSPLTSESHTTDPKAEEFQHEPAVRIAPLFLLDAFEAEQSDLKPPALRQLSISTDESSDTEVSTTKSVRFSHPLVSSVKECPPRVRSRVARERMFYSARDVRRFKKERRQVRFLCRMAGFHEDDDLNQSDATSSEESSASDNDDDEDCDTGERTMSRRRRIGMKNGKTLFVSSTRFGSSRRRVCSNNTKQKKRGKIDEKTLCTPFSKVLLQNLFLLNDGLFDAATQ